MTKAAKDILFWLPRVLGILFALFISVFALDVFDGRGDVLHTILSLAIHLVPTGIVVLVLVIAWRWEWIGGAAFLIFAVLYVIAGWGRFPLSVYFIIAGPMAVMGILFFINWTRRAEIRHR